MTKSVFKNSVIALSIGLVMASCGGSNKQSIVNAADEAWVNADIKIAYIFLADGTYKSYKLSDAWTSNGDGKYKISGTSLTLDATAYPFSIDANSLKITVNGADYTYKRAQSNAPKTQTASVGTTLKDLNDNNWQTVVKENFGITLAVPAGWTFISVNSPNGVNNLILKMTIGEGTTGEAEGKRLFAATKALSPHGNYKNNPNWEAETVSAGDKVNDISEVDRFTDSDVLATWSFTFNSKMIMVNFSAMGNQAAEYMFTINNR